MSAASIAAEVEGVGCQPVSAQTISRTLHQIGLHGCLKMMHKKARKQFAEDKQTKDMDYWNNVLWSEETKMNLFGSDGVKHVWQQPGEEYKDKCVLLTIKHSCESVKVVVEERPPHMIVKRFGCTTIHKKCYINASFIHSFKVWGCMSAAGTGEQQFIEGTMNANMYCEILKQSMIPSLQRLGHRAVFQHDNDRCPAKEAEGKGDGLAKHVSRPKPY